MTQAPVGNAPHHRPRRMPFWSLLDDEARAELLGIGSIVVFPPKETLLRQYDLTDHLLVVRRGCVKVAANSAAGYQAVLAIRNAGDLLGEQAALDGGPRSATLTSLTVVEALMIPSPAFRTAARSAPAIALALQQVLSERLREADGHRAAAGSEAVQARLAALLLELGTEYGCPVGDSSVLIALPLSQDDFAGLVLSSRRTVNRVFEQWRGRGWVTTGRNRVAIERWDELKRLCDTGH
ncbi:Crp/Fnr family transcriptional regulator [Streptomyces venezuelae]|uniref:Crp/Fnr family transcriptional regulator n=1 Tax=Streptomyces gardneri TaxID=66892 RepID=UPI000AFC8ADC|nr:Crp/Fnr family transcriptional regulator [Streptomyces gardneri]WRK37879.1 Crp/Fnr family transcriptional regulator [Streptomyces venezuelae]